MRRPFLVLLALLATRGLLAGLEFHVAPTGRDADPGTAARPFATLERARDAIRDARKQTGQLPAGGVTVWLHAGSYPRTRCFELTAQDSGTAAAPIVYRAQPGAEVRLLGGRMLPPEALKPVTDEAVLAKLPAAARKAGMQQVNLRDLGITDYGDMTSFGMGQPIVPAPLELFYNERPLTLARWPNTGWVTISKVYDQGSVAAEDQPGAKGARFAFGNERVANWVDQPNAWVYGYWCYDWADQALKVAQVDPDARELTLTMPHHYGVKPGKRFYIFNLLSELDVPGEWYLDREAGVAYLLPPARDDGDAPKGLPPVRVGVSLLADFLVHLSDVEYVTFRDLRFELSRGSGVMIAGGAHNRVIHCTFRNLGNIAVSIGAGAEDRQRGEFGVSLGKRLYDETNWNPRGGVDHGVIACDIFDTGEGGIHLGGGDRRTLAAAGNFAVNNHLWRYCRRTQAYRPAIHLYGVGNRVANNLIHDAPHTGIMFWGNEHVIEYNELHHLCQETGDVGMIYTGRDWTMRGNIIRFNYFHDTTGPGAVGAMGVYLDDLASGLTVQRNVFYKVQRAIFVGGGRDNTITDNVTVDCPGGLTYDNRGMGWGASMLNKEDAVLQVRLRAVHYDEEPWRGRYPSLLTVLRDQPAVPKGSVVERNLFCRSGGPAVDGNVSKFGRVKDNWVTKDDPGFVDLAQRNFTLKDDAPAFKSIPGLVPVPFARIGLVADEYRPASSR